jgi:hypothetical protein
MRLAALLPLNMQAIQVAYEMGPHGRHHSKPHHERKKVAHIDVTKYAEYRTIRI